MKEVSRLGSRMSPSLIFLILICSILVSQVFIVWFIGIFPTLPRWGVLLLNAILPSVLIVPIIYFFIFRPLTAHITERSRIEEALRESEDRFCKMAEEVSVIAEIGRVIGSTMDIDEVYERFAAEARKLIPSDRITVNLCNIHENIVTVAYVSGADLSNHKQGDSLPLTGTLLEELLPKRIGQIIQSEKMDEVVRRIPGFSRNFHAGLRSLIAVPLIYKDEVIGVLQFRSKTPDAYTEQDLRLAERIGAQIAGAIANAKLFSDRKRAEEALRDKEQRLSSIYNTVGDVIFHLEVETQGQYRFVSVNPSFCRVTGLSQEQIVGKAVTEVIPEPSLTMVLGKYRQAIEAKTIVRWEEFSEYPAGRLTGEVSVAPVFDDTGKCTHLVGSVHDITARKREEEELQTILDASPIMIFYKDREAKFLRVNKALAETTGLPKEEIEGKKDFEIYHTQDANYWEDDKEVIASGKPKLGIIEPVDTATGRRWVQTDKIPYRDKEGRIIGIIGFAVDITERKQVVEALRNSEEQYRALVDNASDIVFKTDETGHFTFVNPAGIHTIGYEREEIIGRHYPTLIRPDMRDEAMKFFGRQFVKGLQNTYYEYPVITKEGGEIWLGQNTNLLMQNGHVEGFQAMARDITDRKRTEEELRRNQDVAERLAREMAVIAEMGLVIGSTLHIDEVYERFAAETQKLISIDSLTVNLYNSQANTICVAYVSGLNIDGRRQGDPLVLEGSLSEAVIRARASICIQPASFDEIADRFPRLSPIFQAGLRSIQCVPLIYRDEVIGVLHFRSKKQHAYTEPDLRLAERIGMQIAGAIANAQLYSNIEKTENSLRKSEGRFRGLVEEAAVGVAEIEMSTGRFFTVNSRLCEMVGRTKEELLATTFQAITHPEDLHLHEEKTRMMLTGEIDHYRLEKRYLRKDGEIVWVNITVSPLWKPGEKPVYNMIVVEDITDRRKMAEALRHASERLLLATHAGGVGIWELDVVNNNLIWDEQMFHLYGIAPDKFGGTYEAWRAGVHPEDLQQGEAELQMALRGEKEFDTEFRVVWPDGTIRNIRALAHVQRDASGQPTNLIGTNYDITERKRIEEALRESENRYRELSIVDDLTQLYNSRHFYFQLKIELDRSNRYGHPLTLLLLDLDNFKHFNDTYGHVEGDQVLRRLGQVVKRCLRETDFAYRYGGEEFTIVLPMTTSADSAITAERIRAEFKKETFSPVPGQDVHMTMSIGLAQYKSQEDMNVFVQRVDQLMYQSKKDGKDRVCSEL